MPTTLLKPSDLRINIEPDTLGFTGTSVLAQSPLSWIGQERAETAAYFGLAMQQPDYHLFVLGEVGSGRSSLLQQAMKITAAKCPVPPDLCYLYNFDTPEKTNCTPPTRRAGPSTTPVHGAICRITAPGNRQVPEWPGF